jgi:hypothetical protein
MLLHQVDDLGSPGYILFGASEQQGGMACCDVNSEGLAKQAKMAIGRTKQFELPTG